MPAAANCLHVVLVLGFTLVVSGAVPMRVVFIPTLTVLFLAWLVRRLGLAGISLLSRSSLAAGSLSLRHGFSLQSSGLVGSGRCACRSVSVPRVGGFLTQRMCAESLYDASFSE